MTTNTPAVFNFNSNDVRIVDTLGEPWFIAKDVCDALGYGHVPHAMRILDDDEKGVSSIDTLGGIQKLTTVSESGLYALVLRSRKPEARKFAKWVTSEVLPAIRKTGKYETTINPAMQSDLQAIVATISPDGKQRGMIWSRFNRHFKVAKYNQLLISQIDDAKKYLIDTFLEGEYMEKDDAEYWKQYADNNTNSLADIKAIMKGNMSRPSIEPSEKLKRAINQKSFSVAHEFFETFQQHLANRIAQNCEYGCPRTLDENKAMQIVEESSIDTALSHQYYGLLNNLSIMAGNLTTMTNTYQSDINRALGKPERMQLAA